MQFIVAFDRGLQLKTKSSVERSRRNGAGI